MSASGRISDLLAAVAESPSVAVDEGPRPPELPPDTLVGRFRVLRVLGRGGFGVVYEARDTDLGRRVALKCLRPRDLDRFREEAAAAAKLHHPGIVTLHDFGVLDGVPYLVLELLEGETLADRLARGRLPGEEATEIATQLARALAHAHEAGVLHRDLTPANVFLTDDGLVKILDLGLAERRHGAPAPDRSGTPGYMAPEQRRGGPQDERTDLYALGVVWFEMLAGRRPPEGDRTAALLEAGAPGAVAALLVRLLEDDPAGRPASARRLLLDLAELDRGTAPRAGGSPYRWLEAFGEEDAGWFFGRARDIARVERMLDRRSLVAVAGPSGAGKSSLLHAGLLPRLRRRGWLLVDTRPGPDPLARLVARTRTICAVPDAAQLHAKPGLLAEALAAHARGAGRRVVIVVDQLEELIAQAGPSREPFAACLAACGDEPDGPLRVVIALRDDYLARLAESARLGGLVEQNLVLLPTPGRDALAAALVTPARRAGHELEPGLADEIVDALATEIAPLPLLQLAASRLWDDRDEERRLLHRAALDRAGGVAGVLAAHAGEVVASLSAPEARATARRLLCRLVTAERTRRQLATRELLAPFSPDAAVVLGRLIAGRLVTAARGDHGEVVELAHESLIARWTDLGRWLDEDEDARRARDELAATAHAWEAAGRPRRLLYRADGLASVARWRRTSGEALTGRDAAFVAASEAAARRARRARRTAAVAAVAAAIVITAGSLVTVRTLRAEARATRLVATVAAAGRAEDPLVGALTLLELARGGEPLGGADAARQVASTPLPLRVLEAPGGDVSRLLFSADGARVLLTTSTGAAVVLDVDGWRRERALPHPDAVTHAAFAPDDRSVITTSVDGGVRLWPAGAQEPRLLARFTGPANIAVIAPDGRHLAASSDDGSVRLLDLEGVEAPRAVTLTTWPVMGLSYSPDGRRVAAASRDGFLRIIDVAGDAAPLAIRASDVGIGCARFHPDGRRVLTCSSDRTARLIPIDGAGQPVVLRGHRGWLNSAAFDADGSHVLTESVDGTARLWSTDGREEPVILAHDRAGRAVVARLDATGARVATSASDGAVRLWRADGTLERTFRMHAGHLAQVAFSPDGRTLIAADGVDLRVWPLDAPTDPVVFRGHLRAVNAAAVAADGATLVTAGMDGTVWAWRSDGGGTPRRLVAVQPPIYAVALSPGGDEVLAAGADGVARLVPLAGGAERIVARTGGELSYARFTAGGSMVVAGEAGARVLPRDVTLDRGPVRGLAVAGELIATAGGDGVVRLWSSDGTPRRELRRDVAAQGVALDRAGAHVAAVAADGSVAVWDVVGDAPPRVLDAGARRGVFAFSPDGARVVTAAIQCAASLFDLRGGAPVALRGHDRPIGSMAFSPDGTLVVTSSADNTARVWRVDGRGTPVVLRGHNHGIPWVSFVDDERVLTCSFDTTCRVWRVRWDGLIRFLAAETRACLSADERARLLGESADEAAAAAARCAGAP